MSIPTTTTIEDTYQVIDAVPVIPPGGTLGQYEEEGSTQIGVGATLLAVTFATVKAGVPYDFEILEVQNTVDASPLILTPEITASSTAGFSVQFNGAPDTGNYYLKWRVRFNP